MIIVAGMHRSGTSLLCQLMHGLGVDFGDPQAFYQADQWNEEGYFERRDAMDLNSRMITGFARNQGRLAEKLSKVTYLTMPGEAKIARRADGMNEQLREVAERCRDIAVKDPRFCLTLPHWLAVADDACVVVGVRHPSQVARSLKRRQHIPLGVGFRFWNYHIRPLLAHAPAERTLYIDFDQLSGKAKDATTLLRTFFNLAIGEEEAEQVAASIFKPRLVHSNAQLDEELPAVSAELWRKLQEAAAARRESLLGGMEPCVS